MKRLRVEISQLADWDNLLLALYKAARGKRRRRDVRLFLADCDANLNQLQHQIRSGTLPLHAYRCFRIRDPKPRTIVAVSFAMRIVHHAIINLIGESLERSQIHNSFACLQGRGVHAAVYRVQRGLRRSPWLVRIDIEKYFANIDHRLLRNRLERRFKGQRFLDLLAAIIESYYDEPGKGLPIGALTSQYFANFFLENCDRMIERLPMTRQYVRYMDDMIWFCESKQACRESLGLVEHYLREESLRVKPGFQLQPSRLGVRYCGYRVTPHRLLLTRRKKRLWRRHFVDWQRRWQRQEISSLELQRGYDAVHATTWPAMATGFRRSVMEQVGEVDA